MMLLSRRCQLAVAAVVDVALHARPAPVAAKALAARHNLPPRHLETLLQQLVKANVLKGVRGPRGGYELARERRRISVGDILRAALEDGDQDPTAAARSELLKTVIEPAITIAGRSFLAALDELTVEDLCRRAERDAGSPTLSTVDFTI